MRASTETPQKARLCNPAAPCPYVSVYLWFPPCLQAELGLNEHHQNEAISYMRFARFKRGLCLKTVDSCFQDLKDSRYYRGRFWARVKQHVPAAIAGFSALCMTFLFLHCMFLVREEDPIISQELQVKSF